MTISEFKPSLLKRGHLQYVGSMQQEGMSGFYLGIFWGGGGGGGGGGKMRDFIHDFFSGGGGGEV